MPAEEQMDHHSGLPPQAKEEVRRSVTNARKASGDARSAAGATVAEALQRVRCFQDDSRQYVRENPTKAVFTTLGIGFVLGLIFRR